ncbi:MAG TPA: 3-deoxy-D-manno-octulosonic acid transferase [Pyrinomonadaceae bacterium]|nr:3-deoxy-D-manno-octulosonic acid transferase [Pyrinomonadaceae bacterium]
MYFLLSIFLIIEFIRFLPFTIRSVRRDRRTLERLRARFGQYQPLAATGGRPVLWIHCICVGEVLIARPLVRLIRERFPGYDLVITTTSMAGQFMARAMFREEAVGVFYFPTDWKWTVRRALRSINPSVVLIIERELWPRFLRECRKRKVPTAIINGRLSPRALQSYQPVAGFMARAVDDLHLALMQTEDDAERMRQLGLSAERVRVTGNMKFDIELASAEQSSARELGERFRFGDGRPLIVAASTHMPEERILLEAFKQVRESVEGRRARLLIAPREPHRFAEVATLLESSGFNWALRSAERRAEDTACEVILLDSMGELRALYRMADIVFLGGSIPPKGGHSMIEPAAAGACMLTGAHTANFASIVQTFLEADGLIQMQPLTQEDAPGVLAGKLTGLLKDGERRRILGANAQSAFERNRGATARTVEQLSGLLGSPGKAIQTQLAR